MRLRSTASLWESLSRAGLESDRSLWASDTTIALAEFASGSALGERLGEHSRDVPVATAGPEPDAADIAFVARQRDRRRGAAADPGCRDELADVLERNPGNRERFLRQDPGEFIATMERWMAVYCPCGGEVVPGFQIRVAEIFSS